MLGSYLGISFTTSDKRILTFQSFRRSESARTVQHIPIGGKPRTEYLGKDLKQVTFTVELNAMYGVKPRTTEEQVMRKVGRVGSLVIGGRKIGRFMLKKVDSSYETMTRNGEIVRSTLDLTLEEYA